MTERKPEIRFAGYKDNWDIKRFSDVFDILSNNILSRDNLNDESGAALNVHYGDVLIKFGEYLDVSREKLPYISDEVVVAKFQSSFLKDGDIIIADTAEDATVGKCTEICNVGDRNVLPGLHTIPCRPKEQFAAMFLGYYLNSKKYHAQLLPLMQGVKVTSISRSGVQDTRVVVPLNIYEQANIGIWLRLIDEKMAAEKSEYVKLNTLKKAMLEKMFPQKGKLVPEIRFEGYVDNWEQHKLSDITSKIGSGKTPLGGSKSYKDKGIALIRSQNVNGNSIDLSDVVYIDKETDDSMGNSQVFNGDVLLNITGASIGRSAVYKELKHANVNQHVCILRLIQGYNSEFLQLHLASYNGQKQISSSQAGGAREGLNYQQIGRMSFMFPTLDEQREIGEFFSDINILINLHQRRIKKLESIKSTCMQKMFV